MVTVAMVAMTKNPTKKTLSEVTMSKMTTMTTVLHRNLEIDWSSVLFFTVQSVCIHCVLRSLHLLDLGCATLYWSL